MWMPSPVVTVAVGYKRTFSHSSHCFTCNLICYNCFLHIHMDALQHKFIIDTYSDDYISSCALGKTNRG